MSAASHATPGVAVPYQSGDVFQWVGIMCEHMPQTVTEIVRRLERQAAAAKVVDESALPPVTDCVDRAVLGSVSGNHEPEALLHGCLRFVWGEFVTTMYADGRVTFDPTTDIRPSETARRELFTQYNAELDRAYEQVRDSVEVDPGDDDDTDTSLGTEDTMNGSVRSDGGTGPPPASDEGVTPPTKNGVNPGRAVGEPTDQLDMADRIRTSGRQVEAYPGELFAATLGETVGTSVSQVVDYVDPEPGDLVSVTGAAVAANEAVGDQLLSALGDTGTLVSTTRPGKQCQATVDANLTVVDCAGGEPSEVIRCLDSCDNMTAVGTEILEAINDETEMFGFHSLSHLAPTAEPGDHLRFLLTLMRNLRRLAIGGVLVGRPLSLNPQRLTEQVDYHVESRRTDDRVELRVCGRRGVDDRWRPVEVDAESHV